MKPDLKRLRERLLAEHRSGAAMRWALVALFGAGGLISLATVPISSYQSAAERAIELAICLAAVATAAALARWRELPYRAYLALVALGTAMVSVGLYVVSDRPVDGEMFYVWIALYSAFFFTARQAVAQVAFVGAAYAAVLLARGGDTVAMRWTVTMGVLAMTSLIFGWIKEALDRRIAEQERSEAELESLLSLQRATLESTADGILVVDRSGRMVSYNQRFQRMWRIPDEVLEARDDERALGYVLDQLAEPDAFIQKVSQLYEHPEAESHDIVRFKDGRVFERYSQPQRGSDGTVHGRVWSFRDVTKRERSEARLRELADHDALTGLLNRRRFAEEVSARVAGAARYGDGGAVLLLDLDNFKDINDSLGHRTGDAVLRGVAQLLRNRLRRTDVLARLGGDEFAILLPHADLEAARQVADDLLAAIRSHRAIFAGHRIRLTTSIGIAPISAEPVQSAEELLVEADVAMYAAKDGGRDRAAAYEPRAEPARQDGSLRWSERIREALAGDGFVLYGQPIVELRTGSVAQYELLLRMRGPGGELLPPNAFLPSAERGGLVEEIDEWVTRQAIGLIHDHSADGAGLRLEVNVSGRTLASPRLPAAIEDQLRRTPINPASLILEVTETAAIVNMDEARAFATELSRLGCRFALDDFGAGFGSFYYLRHLPLQYLKIDGDFVGGLGTSETDRAVVRAMVEIARQLDMETIAESVTSDEAVRMLRDYGVDYGQGFHVGRPVPVEELLAARAAAIG